MGRMAALATCLFLGALAVTASILFVGERQRAAKEREILLSQVLGAVDRAARGAELGASRIRSSLDRLAKAQAELLEALRDAQGIERPVGGFSGKPEVEAPGPEAPAAAEATPGPEELPRLPEGLEPVAILGKSEDLEAIVADPRMNPAGRTLSRSERYRIRLEFVQAKAKIQLLDAEIHLMLTEGMEALRARGQYLEYAPGERYVTVPGVLSAGEDAEGGRVRLFYFYPEEFGEIYAKRDEREKVAETAVRQVLALLQGQDRAGGASPEGDHHAKDGSSE